MGRQSDAAGHQPASLIGIWVSFACAPYRLLFPAILLSAASAYGISNSVVDVWLMLGCAVVGYFIKIKVETAPLLLGMVLGPQLEENLRRALLLSDGDFSVFVTRPISAVLLGTVVLILVVLMSPAILRKRTEIVEAVRNSQRFDPNGTHIPAAGSIPDQIDNRGIAS